MSKEFSKKGQATTEMAIFGTILLLAFAGLLRWGQAMNKQQEMSMLCFRKALHKAYSDYGGGSGLGAASYRMLKRIRIVEPFNKYYTGRQRQQIGSGNVVFWDPDVLYAGKGDKPKSYYNIDGQEQDLGTDARVWDVVTNTTTYIDNLRLERKADHEVSQDYVTVDTQDSYETIIKTENRGNISVHTQKDYSKEERWTTPWR